MLDAWLELLTDPDHLDATVAAIIVADTQQVSAPPEVSQARRRQKQLHTELDRILGVIRAGMDPQLATGETRKIQAELANVESRIEQ